MAEASNKSGILARAQKRLSRTKTKVLQNLGKAERTTDEQFDEIVLKIERQQESAYHLQKELKKYLHCLEALSVASKSFYSAVEETYEAEWTEEKKFTDSLKASELHWIEYLAKLNEKTVEPMVAYLASFPTLKAKIQKRGRKLMYYDNAKHSVEVIQMAKKKDETKVHKAHEEMDKAKKVYLSINSELHNELPEFHNSRVTFYAQLFEDLFNTEGKFHGEISQVAASEMAITEQLKKDYKDFVYVPKRPISKSFSEGKLDQSCRSVMSVVSVRSGEETVVNGDHSFEDVAGSSFSDSNPSSPVKINGGENIYTNQDIVNISLSQSKQTEEKNVEVAAEVKEETKVVEEEKKVNGVNGTTTEQPDVPDYPPPKPPAEEDVPSEHTNDKSVDSRDEDVNVYDEPKSPKPAVDEVDSNIKTDDSITKEDNPEDKPVYQSPVSNKPVNEAPPNLLYQVLATHPYNGEDVDELSFDTGEYIWVIPYENEDEQDEGWVMGIKQSDGLKGVFPANFTKKT